MTKSRPSARRGAQATATSSPPPPFRTVPATFEPFVPYLDKSRVYITHVDTFPASFKRKIFLVPVAMNVAVCAAFLWWYGRVQGPWYLALISSFAGVPNETTYIAQNETLGVLARVVIQRGFWFLLDLMLFVFVWPWPVEFFFGRNGCASPVAWRWRVGFREREVVVRESRDKVLGVGGKAKTASGEPLDFLKKEGDGAVARGELLNVLRAATAPRMVKEKTGYLTMDGFWDLSWDAMIVAHELVDKKEIAIEAFTLVALVYHDVHGWLVVDLDGSTVGGDRLQQQRRNDVYRFREALVAVGKEDLFYRWIEVVQFESTSPEGFGKERQEVVAKQIRDMFKEQGIDFDEFWKETVGRETGSGM